jgi:hypothetical protein
VRGAVHAVEMALEQAQAGDLLVIQADKIDETVNFLRRYLADKAAEHAVETPAIPAVDALSDAPAEEILAAGTHAGPREVPSAEVGSNISA